MTRTDSQTLQTLLPHYW